LQIEGRNHAAENVRRQRLSAAAISPHLPVFQTPRDRSKLVGCGTTEASIVPVAGRARCLTGTIVEKERDFDGTPYESAVSC
jgi:hypothetical protein